MRALKTPDNPKKTENKKVKEIVFFVCATLIIAISCTIIVSVQTSLALDEYYSIIYTTTIQPQGEEEIQRIVTEVKNISGTSEKLDAIAAWETENFTEYFWEKYRGNDLSLKMMDPPIGRWIYESTGKIRPMNSPYSNNPAWIAHYRFGACGELAHLFAEVANRSGFETRNVMAILKNPTGNHAWVEINVDGEWWYYDPTVYGEYHQLGIQAWNGRWFHPIEEYSIFSPERVAGVYLEDNMTDIGYRYPLLIPPSHIDTVDQVVDKIVTYWHI